MEVDPLARLSSSAAGGSGPGTAARRGAGAGPRGTGDPATGGRPRRPPVAPAPLERVGGAGYDPTFLGHLVPTPTSAPASATGASEDGGGADVVLHYTHFSVAMSRSRRMARWAAWNMDGAAAVPPPGSGPRIRPDPRLPADGQLGEEAYADARIDPVPLARRRDLCWGSRAEAYRAGSDAGYVTNLVPHADDADRTRRGALWGTVEDIIAATERAEGRRLSVLAGPVWAAGDVTYRGVSLPREFWKAVCFVAAGRLVVRAFLVTRCLIPGASAPTGRFVTYQVDLPLLTARTGLRFDPALVARSGAGLPSGVAAVPLASAADLRW